MSIGTGATRPAFRGPFYDNGRLKNSVDTRFGPLKSGFGGMPFIILTAGASYIPKRFSASRFSSTPRPGLSGTVR